MRDATRRSDGRVVPVALLLVFFTALGTLAPPVAHAAALESTPVVVGYIPVNETMVDVAAYDGVNGDLYVVGWSSPFSLGSITVISGVTNSVVASLPAGYEPNYGAVDPATGDFFATNFDPGCGDCGPNYVPPPPNVTVVSGTSNQVIASVGTGIDPDGITYDPTNGNLYVADSSTTGNGTVTVISGTNYTVTATVTVAFLPTNVFYDPLSQDVYVLDETYIDGWNLPNHITVISGANNTVVGSIPLAGTLNDSFAGVVFDPVSGEVLVGGSAGVSVISARSNQWLRTLPIPNGMPSFVDSQGNVYVFQAGRSATMSVLSGSTDTVASKYSIGPADRVSYDPETNEIYSTCWNSCTHYNVVNVSSAATGSLIASLNTEFTLIGYGTPVFDTGNGDLYLGGIQGPPLIAVIAGNGTVSSSGSNSWWFFGAGIALGAAVSVGALLLVRRMRSKRVRAPETGLDPP